MSLLRLPIRTLLLGIAALMVLAAHAQTPVNTPAPAAPKKTRPKPSQSPYNPNLILLDPGHGGSDTGARLTPDSDPPALEKDATIAFANRIKTLLTARGFTVILTHDSASDQLASDQRAEASNRTRAAACILLHASNGGHGVHLFTSALPFSFRATDSDDASPILRWEYAQTASLAQSTRLATALSDTFGVIHIPLVVGHVSVPPIDSMTCPAVAIELAPLVNSGDDSPTPASDAGYQQRIAGAVADGLVNWRTYLQGQIAAAAIIASPPAKPATPAVRKPPPSKPIPIETPVAPGPNPAPAAGVPK